MDDVTRAARRDLARLNYPPENWVLPRDGPDGRPLLDALVVGGGMMGQTAAFALLAEGVANLRVIERADPGWEGPWVTFARMPTLRSPKWVNGPDLGVPALTYRAWFEAREGAEAWEGLHKIDRVDWHRYLAWVRDTVGVAVEHRTALVTLDADATGAHAVLEREGRQETVHARSVVLAFGRGESGRRMPALPSLDPAAPWARERVFHSSDAIDFTALTGARVAVVGAGASAFDNAGTALEAGAAEVALFVRRAALPPVNHFRAFAGRPWPRGYERLPVRERWELYTALAAAKIPPPYESVLRCEAFAQFSARFGEACLDVAPGAPTDGGAVTLVTTSGPSTWDAVILCTGFDQSPVERPELATLAPRLATWGDAVGPSAARANAACARYPFLDEGYALTPHAGADPAGLARVHVFDWSATLSRGLMGGDIPGLELGAVRVASAIAADLFLEDAPLHRARLLAHADGDLERTRAGRVGVVPAP